MQRKPTPLSVLLAAVVLASTSAMAQSYLPMPASSSPAFELNSFTQLPFMQPNARVQMFYDATEVGSNAFVADELALRYDGPIPQVGAPGPFAISHLQIRVGVSAIVVPGAEFSANLTQALTTVFDGPWSYLPDNGSAAPHPWGGPAGTLTFPFTTPTPIVLGPNEWLVVDLTMEGNNIQSFGFAHAILDGATTSGGPSNGSSVVFGQGCATATGQPAASITSTGLFAPGAAHFLAGQNLGSGAPVLAVYGLTSPAIMLPGSTCTLYANPDVTQLRFADAAGSIPSAAAFVLSLPPNAALSGAALFEQLASLVPAANPIGVVLSNATTVTLGGWSSPGAGIYMVAHDSLAGANFANVVQPFGFAVRLRTL